jgi:hypothetical protein
LNTPSDRPDCNRCVHFYITYDMRMPYGCRALGFHGRQLPMLTVQAVSGADCLSFQSKPPEVLARRGRRG